MMRIALARISCRVAFQAAQPLVVISVDGLDNRYLAQADKYGLEDPHASQLMREGQYSQA